MKTYSLLGILLYFFCAVSFISCDKDDSERSEDSTVYYVKYEANNEVGHKLMVLFLKDSERA